VTQLLSIACIVLFVLHQLIEGLPALLGDLVELLPMDNGGTIRKCERDETMRDSITYHPSRTKSLHGRVIEATNECGQSV